MGFNLFKKKDKKESGQSSSASSSGQQARAGQKVFFSIQIDGEPAGDIIFKLYDDVVPKTARNFRELATGQNPGKSYQASGFHRIIPGFMLQGGDYERHNGTGGKCIYPGNGKFEDENFIIKHTRPGLLSMANAGPATNGSQFFITTAVTSHLDGKHVVFGEVIDGLDLVQRIESYGTASGKPKAKVGIARCGVIEEDEDSE